VFRRLDSALLKKDSRSVDPTVIREAANATALREIEAQKRQFLSLSVMADWSSGEWTYRTLGTSQQVGILFI
jgi:isoleucyl-tRNA synthetase